MGLFKNDKKLCPICGNSTPKLFAMKVDNKPICNDCKDKIFMDVDQKKNITLEQLKEHLQYREENEAIRNSMNITRQIDVANALIMHQNLCIDDDKKLWYISGDVNAPVFSFNELVQFTYREDTRNIISITKNGIQKNSSIVETMSNGAMGVVETVLDIANVFLDDDDDDKNHKYESPFDYFYLDFKINNKYTKELSFSFAAPQLVDNKRMEYINDYDRERTRYNDVSGIVASIMGFDVENISGETVATVPNNNNNTTALGADSISEIKKYKDLLDSGIITEEEFAAKKKQLMGL